MYPDTKTAAHLYRLAEVEELLLRYQKANGEPAPSIEMLSRWLDTQNFEKPVRPRPEVMDKYHRPGVIVAAAASLR